MGSSTVQAPTPAGAAATAHAAALVGGLPTVAIVSGQIDATTVADNIPLIPANPGWYFLGVRFAFEILSLTGSASGSLVFSVGNDASHVNIIPAASGTITSGGINALTGASAPPVIGSFNNLGGGGTLVDNATPIVVKIATAPTGVTVMKIRLILYGTWISTAA